jgi:hypothetical protein
VEVLRCPALEQAARRAQEDAEARAFLQMAWEMKEATRRAAAQEEEEC